MKLFNGKVLRVWKDVPNYEGLYQVSTDGKVRSCDRYITYKNGVVRFHKGKEMKLRKDRYGYLTIDLIKNNERKSYKVHRLVAQVFIPNPENKPQIDHVDTSRINNNVTNLRWVTQKENSNNLLTRKHISENHAHFTGGKHPQAKAVYCYELNDIRPTVTQWAEELNLQKSGICLCCKGKRKTCGGYHFKYVM